jgi:hypothetical protein
MLNQDPDLRLLVQTDQEQFLDYCKHEFDSVLSIDQLPRTAGDIVVHQIIPSEQKIRWTQTLVAATILIANALCFTAETLLDGFACIEEMLTMCVSTCGPKRWLVNRPRIGGFLSALSSTQIRISRLVALELPRETEASSNGVLSSFGPINPLGELTLREATNQLLKEFPFWYIPIPKTATTSIRHYISQNVSTFHAHEAAIRGHRTAVQYNRLLGEAWHGLFKFCFVRNPWDRCLSWWLYNRKRGITNDSLLDFLQQPQRCGFRFNCVGYLDDSVKVYRFEEIDAAWDVILDRLGTPKERLTARNQTRGRDNWQEYYSEDARALVAAICQKDIERFNYSFEGKGAE